MSSIGPVGFRPAPPPPALPEPLPDHHRHAHHHGANAPRRRASKRPLKPGELERDESGVEGVEGNIEDHLLDSGEDDAEIDRRHDAERQLAAANRRVTDKQKELQKGLNSLDRTARVPHVVSDVFATGSPAIGDAMASNDVARSAEVAKQQAYYDGMKSPPIPRARYADATSRQAETTQPELIKAFIFRYGVFSAARRFGEDRVGPGRSLMGWSKAIGVE